MLLQEFLQKNDWGIPNDGPVSGYFGPTTKQALMFFQKTNRVPETGETDATTRRLLNALLTE